MSAAVLTKTEDTVVQFKLLGLQRKEIANELQRSEGTIQKHFQNIYTKVKVQNEIELYNWYLENVLGIEIKKILKITLCLGMLILAEYTDDSEMIRAKKYGKSIRSLRSIKPLRKGKEFKLEYV